MGVRFFYPPWGCEDSVRVWAGDGISKDYWAANSGSPEVELRFFPWLILFKYWTGWPDVSPSLCPYYLYAYCRGARPKVSLRWHDLRLNTSTQNDKKFRLRYCPRLSVHWSGRKGSGPRSWRRPGRTSSTLWPASWSLATPRSTRYSPGSFMIEGNLLIMVILVSCVWGIASSNAKPSSCFPLQKFYKN